MEKMSHSMSCEVSTDMHTIIRGYSLDYFSNLIKVGPWPTDSNGLVQCLLRHLRHLLQNFIIRLTIEDGQIVITMITIDECSDVDVNLIPEVQWPC